MTPAWDTNSAQTVNAARVLADLHREAARTQARQAFLPFGDGFLDDDRPDWHGTNVGLQRHADAGESPCPPCVDLINELIVAGLARRSPDPSIRRTS